MFSSACLIMSVRLSPHRRSRRMFTILPRARGPGKLEVNRLGPSVRLTVPASPSSDNTDLKVSVWFGLDSELQYQRPL